METDMSAFFWETLYIVKQMHDHGVGDRLLKLFGNDEIDSDSIYELAWEAIGSVFSDTRHYYNSENEIETLVFFDPVIDSFYRLCEEYEQIYGICPEENEFRRSMKNEVRNALSFGDYSYDYTVVTDTKKSLGCRIVLLFYVDFCCHHEIPGGLLDIRDALVYHGELLRKELAAQKTAVIIPLPQTEPRKEVA